MDKKNALFVDEIKKIRDLICIECEAVEHRYGFSSLFKKKKWERKAGGGGESAIMKGKIFEKIGVNISEVYGDLSEKFSNEVYCADKNNRSFWASGISLVAHMNSPFIPSFHFNVRMIVTKKLWFGGCTDMTPTFYDEEDKYILHSNLKRVCDRSNRDFYDEFSKNCDDYFYLHHRAEPRGVGGIFFDELNSGDWEKDFDFVKNVAIESKNIMMSIVSKNLQKSWNEEDKEQQLLKRGRYVEFNLLHDRGTRFGLMTDGNIDAIMMSMPPFAAWR